MCETVSRIQIRETGRSKLKEKGTQLAISMAFTQEIIYLHLKIEDGFILSYKHEP